MFLYYQVILNVNCDFQYSYLKHSLIGLCTLHWFTNKGYMNPDISYSIDLLILKSQLHTYKSLYRLE